MDDDILEVPFGVGSLYSGAAFSLRNVTVRVFVRSHGCGCRCRLQCAGGFVGDPERCFLRFLDRFLFVATGTATVLRVNCHQESCGLVREQVKDRILRSIYILVGASELGLALLKGPSSSTQKPMCEQRCRRDISHVRTCIACFLCRPDLSFHHDKYVRALHTAYQSCFLITLIEFLGFLACTRLDSPDDVDEVAADVAHVVAGDVGVSHFRGTGARK